MENEGARKEKHARGKRRSETLNTRGILPSFILGAIQISCSESEQLIDHPFPATQIRCYLVSCRLLSHLPNPSTHALLLFYFISLSIFSKFFFFPTYFFFSFYFPTYFSFSSYFPTYFSFFFLFFYLFFFFFFFFFFHLFFHIFLFSLCTPLFKASNLILLPRVSLASSGLSLQPAAERTGKLHSNCRETQLFCPRSIGQLVPS